MMMAPPFTSTVPTRCIEQHPTTQTVYFAGVAINMTQVARSYEPPLDVGYLSRIFNGRSSCSIATAEKIADALGMQLQAFLEELKRQREP